VRIRIGFLDIDNFIPEPKEGGKTNDSGVTESRVSGVAAFVFFQAAPLDFRLNIQGLPLDILSLLCYMHGYCESNNVSRAEYLWRVVAPGRLHNGSGKGP